MIFNLGGGAAAPKLTSIAVTKNPTKTSYFVGDSFAASGMEVTAYFEDGSSSVVTGYTYSPTTIGVNTRSVTISYTADDITKTTTVSLYVSMYLYNVGNEHTNVTGGWVGQGISAMDGDRGGREPTITRTSTYIQATGNDGGYGSVLRTNNKINLDNFKTLHAWIGANNPYNESSDDNDASCSLCIWKSLDSDDHWLWGTGRVASVGLKSNNGSTYSLDVSSLSGEYYVGVGLYSWLGSGAPWATISSMYLTP